MKNKNRNVKKTTTSAIHKQRLRQGWNGYEN